MHPACSRMGFSVRDWSGMLVAKTGCQVPRLVATSSGLSHRTSVLQDVIDSSVNVVFAVHMYPLPNPLARVRMSEQLSARQNYGPRKTRV